MLAGVHRPALGLLTELQVTSKPRPRTPKGQTSDQERERERPPLDMILVFRYRSLHGSTNKTDHSANHTAKVMSQTDTQPQQREREEEEEDDPTG